MRAGLLLTARTTLALGASPPLDDDAAREVDVGLLCCEDEDESGSRFAFASWGWEGAGEEEGGAIPVGLLTVPTRRNEGGSQSSDEPETRNKGWTDATGD